MEFSDSNLQTHSCFVCNSPNLEARFRKSGWQVVTCRDCGFVFVNPRYRDAEAEEIYGGADWFNGTLDSDNGRKNYRETDDACIKRAKQDVLAIEKLKAAGSLLDVGCGLGHVLDAAKERGWNVHGIDISRHAVSVCKANGHEDVQCGTLETVGLGRERFDVITAFDVFEHVCDPNIFLQEVHRLLKSDGIFVVAVPNVRSLGARINGERWGQYILPEHLNYFCSPTLDKILRKNQFKVLRLFSEPSISIGLRQLIRRLTRNTVAESMGGEIINSLTSFKQKVFYPPINLLVKRLGMESNLLVAYVAKQT